MRCYVAWSVCILLSIVSASFGQDQPPSDPPVENPPSQSNPAEPKPEAPEASKKAKRQGAIPFVAQLEKKINAAEPTPEQREKLKAIYDEYAPKLAELTKKYNEAIPEDLRKQLNSARKEIAATGVKGKDLAAALTEKVKLTEEQTKQSAEIAAEREKQQREVLTKVTEILTSEQISKAGIKIPKAKKKDKSTSV